MLQFPGVRIGRRGEPPPPPPRPTDSLKSHVSVGCNDVVSNESGANSSSGAMSVTTTIPFRLIPPCDGLVCTQVSARPLASTSLFLPIRAGSKPNEYATSAPPSLFHDPPSPPPVRALERSMEARHARDPCDPRALSDTRVTHNSTPFRPSLPFPSPPHPFPSIYQRVTK